MKQQLQALGVGWIILYFGCFLYTHAQVFLPVFSKYYFTYKASKAAKSCLSVREEENFMDRHRTKEKTAFSLTCNPFQPFILVWSWTASSFVGCLDIFTCKAKECLHTSVLTIDRSLWPVAARPVTISAVKQIIYSFFLLPPWLFQLYNKFATGDICYLFEQFKSCLSSKSSRQNAYSIFLLLFF